MTSAGAPPPAAGAVVVDEACGRVGEVVGEVVAGEAVLLRLRPVRGGREWNADPHRVRAATPAERLQATLAAVNAASRWEVR